MSCALGLEPSVVLSRLHEGDLGVVFAVEAATEAENEVVRRLNVLVKGLNQVAKAVAGRSA